MALLVNRGDDTPPTSTSQRFAVQAKSTNREHLFVICSMHPEVRVKISRSGLAETVERKRNKPSVKTCRDEFEFAEPTYF